MLTVRFGVATSRPDIEFDDTELRRRSIDGKGRLSALAGTVVFIAFPEPPRPVTIIYAELRHFVRFVSRSLAYNTLWRRYLTTSWSIFAFVFQRHIDKLIRTIATTLGT